MLYFRFDCPRTCPLHGERICRFGSVFSKIGPTVVESETVNVNVEFSDPAVLHCAVSLLGGQWLGRGTYRLSEDITGYGFCLPGWRYPLVMHDGKLSFDDYHWGYGADIEKLKAQYTLAMAGNAALAQGWAVEYQGESLTIYHPSSGTLTVTPGGIDANGFTGGKCHDAIMALGLPVQDARAKPEVSEVVGDVQTIT